MKRNFRTGSAKAASSLLVAGLFLAACSGDANDTSDSGGDQTAVGEQGEPVEGGDLVVATMPTVLDPYQTTSRSNWMVAASVCESLWTNDATMQIHDGLIDSYEYNDETSQYEITLREDVPFHNGGTLTSDDVKASLERFMGASAGADVAELIASIEVEDELNLTITTNGPASALPALLATPDTGAYIFSAASIEAAGDSDLTELDCTGPYKLDSFTPDREAVISRFDDYASRDDESNGSAGAKVAYADTIKFIPHNESNTINQVSTGQVHIAPQFVSIDQLDVYESDPNLVPAITEDGGFSLIQFNMAEGLASDKLIREAVLNAVDPEALALMNLGSLDYYSNISSMFPEESPWYSEAGSDIYNGRDPEKVQDLLDEAGYNGEPLRILYRASTSPWGPLLEQQLTDAGFNVEMMAVDAAAFGEIRTDPGEWDLFLAAGNSYSDPMTVVFLNDEFPGWWTSETKFELSGELAATTEFEDRYEIWEEYQGLIWEELPFIKLGHEPRLAVISDNVGGFVPSQGTARGFFNVWTNE